MGGGLIRMKLQRYRHILTVLRLTGHRPPMNPTLTVIKVVFTVGYGTDWNDFTGYVNDITINGDSVF